MDNNTAIQQDTNACGMVNNIVANSSGRETRQSTRRRLRFNQAPPDTCNQQVSARSSRVEERVINLLDSDESVLSRSAFSPGKLTEQHVGSPRYVVEPCFISAMLTR